ncbi:MAG: TonB-dependent receptor [Desulfonauticus sp.]|nr:TonB-dependent receptor [Desulfonauticus sp.]
MRRIVILLGLLAFFLVAQSIRAEEVELGEVVVTATRTEIPATQAPASVTVITKKEMEKENIKTLDEALRNVSGIFLRRGKGLMDTLAAVSLRGLPEQKRTLILIDGIPLNNAYTSGVEWNSLALDNIERIEVVKGPFSALYGGNAMGGVINIITKTPERRQFNFKLGYGSHSTAIWSVYYGDKITDKLTFVLGYEGKDTDGYINDYYVKKASYTTSTPGIPVTGWKKVAYKGDPDSPGYIFGDKGKNWIKTHNFNSKVNLSLTDTTKLSLFFQQNGYKYGYEDGKSFLRDLNGEIVDSGIVEIEGNNYKVYPYYFLGGYGKRTINIYSANLNSLLFNKVKFNFKTAINDYQTSWYVLPQYGATSDGGKGKLSSTPSEIFFSDLKFDIPHFQDKGLLILGFSYKHEQATTKEWYLNDWRNIDDKSEEIYNSHGKTKNYAIYMQEQVKIFDNLMVFAGARCDFWKTYNGYYNDYQKGDSQVYSERSHDAFSPKLAMVWEPDNSLKLRASIGRAFRAPNIYELYRTWWYYSTVYRGNPDLKPEWLTSWEFGLNKSFFNDKTNIDISYYENYIDDMIYTSKVADKEYLKINAGKAEVKGLEIELHQKINDWLKIFGTYSYKFKMEITENPAKPESEGKYIPYVPKKTASFGITADIYNCSATLSGTYISKVYRNDDNSDTASDVPGVFDEHFVANFKVLAKFKQNHLIFSFAVDNIFDEEYFWSYKAPGRTFWGQIEYKF